MVQLDVAYVSQRDNQYDDGASGNVSCFPTAVSMCIHYCLEQSGLDRTAIGCRAEQQVEDFLNETMDSDEVASWMEETFPKNWWGWGVSSIREIFAVEEYVFNKLLGSRGYAASTTDQLTYEAYKAQIDSGMPCVLSGNFKSVSRVGGHMCCGIGYGDLNTIIVHDPFGSALKGYPTGQTQEQNDEDGYGIEYGQKLFMKANNKMTALIITK